MRNTIAKSLVFLCIPLVINAQNLPSPEKHFGHMMGAEGKIINFFDGLKYYQKLADRSDRILYTELGKTTDGNPFVLLIISSPENLRNLESIKEQRHRLSDPRKLSEDEAGKLARQLPAVVFHTSSIHTTEISTAQVIPELVYTLVSGDNAEIQRMLKNTIVLVSPSANPDGQVKIKEWYDQHEGKPWESRMPWLYHTYVGHDNNRDWILLHFPEQRLTAIRIFMEWHPIYSHEMHQMGGRGARIFVPPYQDPYDPNTAPEVMETMAIVGTAMSHRLTMEGKAGVVKNSIYDLFTPARAFQIYRGTARVLTETASANFAKKQIVRPGDLRGSSGGTGVYHPLKKSWNFPMPWAGGEWTFREMVEYQLSAGLAAINVVSGNPGGFNLALYRSLKPDVVRWPYAYVLPAKQHDRSALKGLLQAMQDGQIEVHRADRAFVADGHGFEAGSHVIVLNQPYGAWAKTMLEIQEYPDLRRSPDEDPIVPYDVTAQTLPLMMGVDAVEIKNSFDASLSLVDGTGPIKSMISGSGVGSYLVEPNSNEAYAVMDALLDDGYAVAQISNKTTISGHDFPSGSFYVRSGSNGLAARLKELSNKWTIDAFALAANHTFENEGLADLNNPRIGLYEPWGGVIDAGWTRHIFEQWELEYETVRQGDVKAGKLGDKFDILIFPDGMSARDILEGTENWPEKYRGGIGDNGRDALRNYVENGGTIAAFGRTSMSIIELLDLPIANSLEGLTQKQYFAPGSLVLAELDPASPLAYGLPTKLPVMNRRGPAFVPRATTRKGPRMHASYPDYDPRLSGFLLGPEHIQGKGAIAVQAVGQGRVILFSMNPQFRAMTHGSYKLVFNAIFWAARRTGQMEISSN